MYSRQDIIQALEASRDLIERKLNGGELAGEAAKCLDEHCQRYIDTLKLMPDLPFKTKLLDVGFGYGHLMYAVQFLCNYEVYGVDTSIHFQTKDPQIFKIDISTQKLPFANDSFGVVLFCESLEHINPQRVSFVMSEIRRVLRNDGYLILTTPNGASLNSRLRILMGKERAATSLDLIIKEEFGKPHVREYTLGEVSRVLFIYGYTIEAIKFSTGTLKYFFRKAKPQVKILVGLYYIITLLLWKFRGFILFRAKLKKGGKCYPIM